jgi:hypothetical protein
MKRFLFITNVVVVNLVLGRVFYSLSNPFDFGYWDLLIRPEFWFSPDPVYNILMLLSLIGLVTFNASWILNRKK